MKIFNTLTRRKEEFVPLTPGQVKMYVCGPTVYNLIHIGNARPMIVFDTVRRYFEYKGYDVQYVSNFTDVDDKIIKKANEEGVDAEVISKRYIEECKKDMAALNVKPATVNPQATQEIQGMLTMIQTLIDKGHAYVADDGTVYFKVKSFKEYGKLSHKNLDELQSGFRELKVSGEEVKEDPNDFVLWKPKKEGEPYWESPWCQGRPGWHIECSVMAKHYLGDQIDIHAGGEDLIFPHHENEIAQSECANDKTFANYWMHNGFLNIDNKKMSKSLGNFFTVRDIAENPKNIQFREVEAAQVPNVLQDVDYAVINSNYAISAKLNPVQDSLAMENSSSSYSNILAVKAGNENTDAIKALKAALESQKVADFITEKYQGSIISVVQNPGNGFDDSVNYDALAGTTISIAASPTPHAEILAVAKEILAEKNITLDIKEFTDYVQPNNLVESGEIDANYFQHLPYLEDFNKENHTNLVSVGAIHVEPMGLYGGKQTSLDALQQ